MQTYDAFSPGVLPPLCLSEIATSIWALSQALLSPFTAQG